LPQNGAVAVERIQLEMNGLIRLAFANPARAIAAQHAHLNLIRVVHSGDLTLFPAFSKLAQATLLVSSYRPLAIFFAPS